MNSETVRELGEYAKQLFDEVAESMHQLSEYPRPSPSDSPTDIQSRMFYLGDLDNEIAGFYRKTLRLQQVAEKGKSQAKRNLEDKKMEEVAKKDFKLIGEFSSRTEVDLKLRARAIEEVHTEQSWEVLCSDLRYLADTIRSYQFQIKRERNDIDTRLRYFYMG